MSTSLKFLICSFNILHGNFSISNSQYVCLAFFWRRQWHPTPVLLPGKSHGQRSLVGCSPWGLKELDTTERLHFNFLLSCIGEGNGNPLQFSCLENPRDGWAWWAAVYGVPQSRTQLKWLSSSTKLNIALHRVGREKISQGGMVSLSHPTASHFCLMFCK